MFKNLFISLLLTASFSAYSAVEKIAYVDFQLALETVNDGVKAKEKLEKEKVEKEKSFTAKKAAFSKMTEEYQKKSAVLSDDAKMKKEKELQDAYMKLQQEAQGAMEAMQTKQAELSKPIMDSLREVISEVAKEKKYDLVFEKNMGGIMYAKDADNITNSVIERYNKIHSGGAVK